MTKFIDKQGTIERFKKEHAKLKKFVFTLPEEKFLPKIVGDWSIKDVIAHLAAWNWEVIDEVDRVLKNKAIWPGRYDNTVGEDEFNRKEVEKRRDKSWEESVKDWDDSFSALIKRMERLSDDEWRHQSGNQTWSDNAPVTVFSLFDYEYEGEGHEGGHAKQIVENLKGVIRRYG